MADHKQAHLKQEFPPRSVHSLHGPGGGREGGGVDRPRPRGLPASLLASMPGSTGGRQGGKKERRGEEGTRATLGKKREGTQTSPSLAGKEERKKKEEAKREAGGGGRRRRKVCHRVGRKRACQTVKGEGDAKISPSPLVPRRGRPTGLPAGRSDGHLATASLNLHRLSPLPIFSVLAVSSPMWQRLPPFLAEALFFLRHSLSPSRLLR